MIYVFVFCKLKNLFIKFRLSIDTQQSDTVHMINYIICDRILENSSKSHMKSSVFLHVFNDISLMHMYFIHSFSNLSIEFHVVIWNIIENTMVFMWQ